MDRVLAMQAERPEFKYQNPHKKPDAVETLMGDGERQRQESPCGLGQVTWYTRWQTGDPVS